jgi:CubicO group peptidase (beta-lactamase class C family)
MKGIISIFITLAIFGCSAPAPQYIEATESANKVSSHHIIKRDTIPPKQKAKVLNYFRKFIKRRHFNGHVLIAKGNTIILDTTTGYSNMRKKIPLKKNSAVQLASITKPITSTVLLQLVEEGKLNIADTITKFLPNLPKHYSNITIEHLLAHRSGLSQYYYYCDAMMDNKDELIYNDTVLCVIDFHNPDPYFKPGKRHNYCNTNYLLLASIIESIEDDSYPNVVQKRIFDACNMDNSFVIDIKKDSLPSNLTLGHNLRNRVFELDYLDGIVGDKGVFSTAKDLFKFDRFLSDCGILNDSILQLAHSPHNKIKKNASYGYGWRLRYHENLGKIVYHTGWWHGNRHAYFKIPNSDYTVIILSNALRGSVYSLNELLNVFDFENEAI